jgi:hypothetical protein
MHMKSFSHMNYQSHIIVSIYISQYKVEILAILLHLSPEFGKNMIKTH